MNSFAMHLLVFFAGVIVPSFANFHVDEELVLVHTLFRHGDRTADAQSRYPTDPHINETYYPYGVGQLTNKGRRRMFALGEYMRKKYGNFIPAMYSLDTIDAVSTEMNRTKASLQLVLAGLFPPQGTELDWNPKLNWQPIPYNYLLYQQNNYITISLYYCPNYINAYRDYWKSPEGFLLTLKYKHLFEYVSKHTGLHVNTTFQISSVYAALFSEEEWNLPLPEWTKFVYPDKMKQVVIDDIEISTATHRLKQLSGGFLLRKILRDTQLKIDGKLPPQRKIFLYSAHDLNVAQFLRTLEVYFPHVIPYGACVLLEVYKRKTEYGIKIFYQDYTKAEPKPLKVPGCDYFCPIEKFVKILHNNIPKDNEDKC